MLAGLRHPDSGEYPCGPVDLRCYISICRDHASWTPSGPREVQQGPGVSYFDHGPFPILWSAGHSHQAYPTSHQQGFHREILHAQEGVGLGTAAARGGPAVANRSSTAPLYRKHYPWGPSSLTYGG